MAFKKIAAITLCLALGLLAICQAAADYWQLAYDWQTREGRKPKRIEGEPPTVAELQKIFYRFHLVNDGPNGRGRWLTSREMRQNRFRGDGVDLANYAYVQFRENTSIADDDLKVVGFNDNGQARFVVAVRVKVSDYGSRVLWYDPLIRLPTGRMTEHNPRRMFIEYNLFDIRRL